MPSSWAREVPSGYEADKRYLPISVLADLSHSYHDLPEIKIQILLVEGITDYTPLRLALRYKIGSMC